MFLRSKLPTHLDWRTQLRTHKWHTGKMNSRFDHRRLSMVLWENLVESRNRNHQVTGMGSHDQEGNIVYLEVDPLELQYKYVKYKGKPVKIEFNYSDDGRII